MIKILMILTAQATMGSHGPATGVWFEELSAPYYAFVDAGIAVEIASIPGGRIPVDPHSLHPSDKNPASVERFLNDETAMRKISSSWSIDDVKVGDYAAVFLPGGHGTMWDLPQSDHLAAVLNEAWESGKVLAAVCHGPAGLVNARDVSGLPLVSGRRVSAFTNSEEAAVGLAATVPFALESRLRELGARYESGPDFQPYAVRDGRLVTGQNPASSEPVARLVLEALRESQSANNRSNPQNPY
jgi:putative intracellular protease/amidase